MIYELPTTEAQIFNSYDWIPACCQHRSTSYLERRTQEGSVFCPDLMGTGHGENPSPAAEGLSYSTCSAVVRVSQLSQNSGVSVACLQTEVIIKLALLKARAL